MKAKKIISMLLVSVTALGLLAGCGSQEENQTNSSQQKAQNKADTAEGEENGESAGT